MVGLMWLTVLAGAGGLKEPHFPEYPSSEICPVAEIGHPLVTSGSAIRFVLDPGGSLPRGDSLTSGSKSSRVQGSLEANANCERASAAGP